MQSSLQVQVPPKFVQSPSDKVASEKEELELVCAIRGKVIIYCVIMLSKNKTFENVIVSPPPLLNGLRMVML